jgi:hypothetical protein
MRFFDNNIVVYKGIIGRFSTFAEWVKMGAIKASEIRIATYKETIDYHHINKYR